MFGRKSNFSSAQYRGLISCAVMIMGDLGPKGILRFDLAGQKPAFAQNALAKTWEISDADKAVAVMARLVKGEDQTPAVAEVFEHIIKENQYEIARGIFAPIKQEGLANLDLPKNFVNFWKSVTNNANEDIDDFIGFLENPAEARQSATFHNITLSLVLSRLNKYVKGYETALRALRVFGYTTEELLSISNFAAWDLGRCGHIAKMAAFAGYISEDEAWKFLLAVGDEVYKTHDRWRQFLAAYFLGRCMAYSADDMENFGDIMRFLLKDKKSPYRIFPLKNA